MKYSDGQEVRLGDKVKLGSDESGVVGCIIDRDEYSDKYPKANWGYLGKGVVVHFDRYGEIHYPDGPESDLVLLARA